MSDSNGLTNEVVLKVNEVAKGAARIALKKLAPEYGLNPDDMELTFDATGDYHSKVNRGTKVEIICGGQMRPTDFKQFGADLRRVLQLIVDERMVGCKSIELVEMIKKRNDKYVEMYERMRKSKLIPDSRLSYQKFLSIMVMDDVTKQSVVILGKEGETVWDLQKQAIVILSKKVLGE